MTFFKEKDLFFQNQGHTKSTKIDPFLAFFFNNDAYPLASRVAGPGQGPVGQPGEMENFYWDILDPAR